MAWVCDGICILTVFTYPLCFCFFAFSFSSPGKVRLASRVMMSVGFAAGGNVIGI